MLERVGVQAAAVALDAQQFFDAHVAEVHTSSEMVEQGELTRLVRRLEDHGVESKRVGKPVGERRVEAARIIEQTHACCTFARLDNQLEGARVEPAAAL